MTDKNEFSGTDDNGDSYESRGEPEAPPQSCKVCKRTVSTHERIYMPNQEILHLSCFKCRTCTTSLSILQYYTEADAYYCYYCYKRPQLIGLYCPDSNCRELCNGVPSLKSHLFNNHGIEASTRRKQKQNRKKPMLSVQPSSKPMRQVNYNPTVSKRSKKNNTYQTRLGNSSSGDRVRELRKWSKLAMEFKCKHCGRTCTTREKLVKKRLSIKAF